MHLYRMAKRRAALRACAHCTPSFLTAPTTSPCSPYCLARSLRRGGSGDVIWFILLRRCHRQAWCRGGGRFQAARSAAAEKAAWLFAHRLRRSSMTRSSVAAVPWCIVLPGGRRRFTACARMAAWRLWRPSLNRHAFHCAAGDGVGVALKAKTKAGDAARHHLQAVFLACSQQHLHLMAVREHQRGSRPALGGDRTGDG